MLKSLSCVLLPVSLYGGALRRLRRQEEGEEEEGDDGDDHHPFGLYSQDHDQDQRDGAEDPRCLRVPACRVLFAQPVVGGLVCSAARYLSRAGLVRRSFLHRRLTGCPCGFLRALCGVGRGWVPCARSFGPSSRLDASGRGVGALSVSFGGAGGTPALGRTGIAFRSHDLALGPLSAAGGTLDRERQPHHHHQQQQQQEWRLPQRQVCGHGAACWVGGWVRWVGGRARVWILMASDV